MSKKLDELEAQIRKTRQSIASDGYPMSIGEITNMYKEGELIVRPEFQRFFRWTDQQKSNLIESLLLGIPIPSIFVAQNEDGKWELVDGLQRISTILEIQGELKDGNNNKMPMLELLNTKYLPALLGKKWQAEQMKVSLSDAQRLDIKRTKIDVKNIKRESSPRAKFDLFQRLNSYGTQANAQEMRSALLVATSLDFFSWLERLASYKPFVDSLQLSERLIEERYDLELALRFFVLHTWPENKLTQTALRDFSQVLDDASVELAANWPKGTKGLEGVFKKTFKFIQENAGENAFRKWDVDRKEFRGSFLNTSFEVFALGVGYYTAIGGDYRKDLLNVVKQFWRLPDMRSGFATGRSTEARMADFIPRGRELLRA